MSASSGIQVQAVVLAGGSGSRLWPVSRQLLPKQFLNVAGDRSLIEETIARLSPLVEPENVVIVSNQSHISGSAYNLTQAYETISEPEGRNTAPAVGLAAIKAVLGGNDPIQIVLPADHVIRDEQAFRKVLESACKTANKGALVTFGIRPDVPATGFGYIRASGADADEVRPVCEFVEKPDLEHAQQYVRSGDYFWNAGIFVWRASTILAELARYLPDVMAVLKLIMQEVEQGATFAESVDRHFNTMPSISIDYGVLEPSDRVQVIPCDIGWNDVGSWEAVHDISDKDEHGNVIRGRALAQDCHNSLIKTDSRLVAGIGLENICVIDTNDAVLVCPLDRAQEVKQLVDVMKSGDFPELVSHQTVRRPWGEYSVLLEGDSYKIKQIVVNPGGQLSLQMHHYRSEHWVVVAGVAEVQRGDEKILLHQNESSFIPQGTRHRLANPGNLPLKIIEVQSGEYVGEDDIVRFDDNYGRVESG
ncbi:MAG: mannose-1-phosphate guanylyltransferase/mannose-6-phosphate isomerase [Mariprofundaceae bacterium]